ncbi:hypothetical protein M514_03460 [Trichuris suis]|uniref:Uncharacterized protein n=1 Tax=Trichuris suis TaxID=68888 RepID=A0A085NDQ5_9BILA|nr:hypothetical protein M513_03460 [Trichuris suis]KFD67601.1 hypothetical protein M514_03460 [Trichuris suis]
MMQKRKSSVKINDIKESVCHIWLAKYTSMSVPKRSEPSLVIKATIINPILMKGALPHGIFYLHY